MIATLAKTISEWEIAIGWPVLMIVFVFYLLRK